MAYTLANTPLIHANVHIHHNNYVKHYKHINLFVKHDNTATNLCAREYNIPWSTFKDHVHKLHAQQQSIHNINDNMHTQSSVNNNQTPSSHMPPFTLPLPSLPSPPSTLNNNSVYNNKSSLTDIHAIHGMQHNFIDICTHLPEVTRVGVILYSHQSRNKI